MKLVLHLVRTDLRRLWPWLATITAIVTAMNAIGFWLVAYLPLDSELRVAATLRLVGDGIVYLRLAGAFVAYGFVILLVQGDRTVGTMSFWLTRPISGGRLFIAKGLTLMLALIVIPSALSIPWWWTCGFGPLEMSIAAAEFALFAVVVGAPAALVAVFTDSIPRALAWGMLAVPITLTLMIVGMARGVLTLTGALASVRGNSVDSLPNLIVSIGAAFLVMVLAVATLYTSRRIGRSVAILGFGCLVAFSLGAPGAPRWLRPDQHDHDADRAAGIRTDFISETTWIAEKQGEKRGNASVGVNMTGVPSGRYVDGDVATTTWTWPDRDPIQRIGGVSVGHGPVVKWMETLGYHGRPWDPETQKWQEQRTAEFRAKWRSRPEAKTLAEQQERNREQQRALWRASARLHWETQPTNKPNLTVTSELPASVVARLWKEPAAYHAEFPLALLRPELAAAMPFGSKNWKADHGRGLRAGRRFDPKSPNALVILTSDPDNLITSSRAVWSVERLRRAVAVMNPALREALMANLYPLASITVNSVSISCDHVSFWDDWVIRDGKRQLGDLSWYKDAVLTRLTAVEEARFTRMVTGDHLVTHDVEP